ncbi:MAG TPA: hemolysin family protein [Terriglobales bacterium]|nr:hemolysin family protein [Terriglobales bacterium]
MGTKKNLIRKLLNPLLKLLIRACKYPSRLGTANKTSEERFEQRIESLELAEGEKMEALEEDEKKMIHSIFKLGETAAKEIMIPRIDMICVEGGEPLDSVKELVKKYGHSRIPLFRESIDQIIGILHVKDIFVEEGKESAKIDLAKTAHKPFFIPEDKKIDELLQEMRKDKQHIAIVVDEYGGTAGLVTIEDILEEIVGEIEDEHDRAEPAIQKISEEEYRIAAKVTIPDLNEAMGSDLPEKEFETLGGLIYDLVGGVPEEGKTIEYRGLNFKVEKVKGQRIIRVKVKKMEDVRQ